MSNIVAVLIVRCTHTGVYADGRPNLGSVTLYDLDEITIQKNRTRYVPIPAGETVDIPMSTRTFVSWHNGDICKFTMQGLIRSEIILQLRDKQNCGGPLGTGQALRPAVLNAERTGGVLRFVLPDNVIPTNLDSLGFMVGEPVEITGFPPGSFRRLNGQYVISSAFPGNGLAGPAAGSYLIEVPSNGPDIPATTLAGVNFCLTEGRVVSQFNSSGNVGGFGANVFGYVGGQLLPGTGGGGGAVAVYDEGILVDPAVSSFDFIGAGVTVTSAGPGAVDVTVTGGGAAPVGAEYLVLSTDPTLTDERVFTAGTGISVVDGGAGGLFTVSVSSTLAEILSNGNDTGGTSLLVTTGDSILGVTDLVLTPGVGSNLVLDGFTWPNTDGLAGDVLTTDGAGNLTFQPPGGSVSTTVNQVGHGFVISNAIYYDGALWQTAQANSGSTLGTHLVTQVIDADNFVATQAGRVTTFAGLIPGAYYFVSAVSAGSLVTTDPSVSNPLFFSNPILMADSATSGWVLPWRAYGPGNASGGTLVSLFTTLNNVPTISQSIGIPTNGVMLIETRILASEQAPNLDKAAYIRTSRVNVVASVPTVVTTQSDFTSEDDAAWDVSFSTAGASVTVVVTGDAVNAVDWKIVTTVQVL